LLAICFTAVNNPSSSSSIHTKQ